MSTNRITINANLCEDAPANGYLVFYRPENTTIDYRTAGPFTESPFVIDDYSDPDNTRYTGYIQADCGDGNFGPKVYFFPVGYKCGDSFAGSWPTNEYHNYGKYYLDTTTGTPLVMTINYNCYDRPNRFTVRNELLNTVIATTDWVGIAAYPGPWGPSLSTPIFGTLSFSVDPAIKYSLQVEGGGGTLSDAWDVLLTCTYEEG